MRILVTGGAGFIGSHVVDLLISEGHNVTVLDNLSSGRIDNLNPAVRFLENDIREPLDQAFSGVQPDVVIHLAAQVSVPDSVQRPDHDLSVNLVGTVNVLMSAARAGVKKVIFVSSAAVYGTRQELPLREDSAAGPVSPYGLSKLSAEEYVRLLCNLHGMQYTILRPANAYGPRQRSEGEGAVIPAFLGQFLNGKDPVVHGTGEQTRDFIYVGDIATAVMRALTRAEGLTLNISTGRGESVLSLWSALADLTGWERPPRFGPHRSGDITHSIMANDAARAELDWEPRTGLLDGLASTVAWARRRSKIALDPRSL